MSYNHGGNIYSKNIQKEGLIDFSININPQGISQNIVNAFRASISMIESYPEMNSKGLISKISLKNKINQDYIIAGNGASELIMAIFNAVKPKSALALAPSFFGYEHGANSVECSMNFIEIYEEEIFDKSVAPYERMFDEICRHNNFLYNDDLELVFLTNPNNPTGTLIPKDYLIKIIEACAKRKIWVVLDECFIEFTEGDNSLLDCVEKYNNLIILRAFTKIYSIPGIRLGYLICSDRDVIDKINKQLPEWNVSTIAQKVGEVALDDVEYVERTAKIVAEERKFLIDGIKSIAKDEISIVESEANFILFKIRTVKSEFNLYDKMGENNILIRDCSNYRGLSQGYYRIAVKGHDDNEIFLDTFRKVWSNM